MTLFCFVIFLLSVVYCLTGGHSLLWALGLGTAAFYGLGRYRGVSRRALFSMAWEKGRSALVVVPVLLLIGTLTGLWRASGTISFFLYYGLRSISPSAFLLVAFLLCALLSYALGTSFGVTGTAGVVLITIARSGGVSLPLAAGAILSGAYFGDRCAPTSSCANLVAVCTNTDLYGNIREMLKTALLPTALSAAIYGLLSLSHPLSGGSSQVLSALQSSASLHIAVALPAVLMLLLPLFNVPAKAAMACSALCALGLAVFLQHLPLEEALRAALFGYHSANAALEPILSGGGLVSMLSSCAIVFTASLYAGILEGIDVLAPIHRQTARLSRAIGLFPTTVLVSLCTVCMFCNQAVTVLMAEQLMAENYRAQGASRRELAVDLSNSGVVLAGLIPWSIAASVPLAMLDVGAEALGWAVLLYLIPLCYLFTRRFFHPRQETEKFQKGSEP